MWIPNKINTQLQNQSFSLTLLEKTENGKEKYIHSFVSGFVVVEWFKRDFTLKRHRVCQGDTRIGVVLFWDTCSGISEHFKLQAFKGAYLSALSA